MGKSVYITGISGQIGAHLGRYLRRRGYFVTGIDIASAPPEACDEFRAIDIVSDRAGLADSLRAREYACLVHLAAIVAPTDEPADRLFAVNVVGTHNVVRAAAKATAPRLIYMSSESVLGFAFAEERLKPLFMPITEEHPLRAVDPYGTSKLLGERVAALYHDTTGSPAFSLRPPWVWIPEKRDRYLSLVKDPSQWAHGLWAYIVIEDLCAAVERAMICDVSGYHACFLAADDQGTPEPTHLLLEKFYDFRGPFRNDFKKADSVISSKAAKSLLDWAPRWNWRSWLENVQRTQPHTDDQSDSVRVG